MSTLITREELSQFFHNGVSESVLQELAEDITFQMEQAHGIIEQNRITAEKWPIYKALQTIQETKLPHLIERKDGFKRYSSRPLIGQEELEQIQEIINNSYFPKKKPRTNSILPKAFGYMLFDIHIKCEKINPDMPWYSEAGTNEFDKLALLIANKMGLDNDSLPALLRHYVKDISKPARDEQKKFSMFMKKELKCSKYKLNSPEFRKAFHKYQNLK